MKKFLVAAAMLLSSALSAHAITSQQEGALAAVADARTMQIINSHCHYAPDAEINGFVKQFESFAGKWMKQFPEFDASYRLNKMRQSFATDKQSIKKSCADPNLKKYFFSMYNLYTAGEGAEQD